MARRCDLTGKRPLKGNHVSHANNKVKRVQNPNLHTISVYSPLKKRTIKLKVAHKILRSMNKFGIDAVLKKHGLL